MIAGIKVPSEGNVYSRVFIVGEAPGKAEEIFGRPFVGTSGQELDRMLHEAGFLRTECYLTNVVKYRPRDNDVEHFYAKNTPKSRIPGPEMAAGMEELLQDIAKGSPDLIIALGDTALWALTGKRGIVKWRGSELRGSHPSWSTQPWIIPTYHPSAILRVWEWRFAAMCDLRRARRVVDGGHWQPERHYLIRPGFSAACAAIDFLAVRPQRVAVDIETRAGHIACIGFAWSENDAVCIPLMCVEREDGYWSLEEERDIIFKLRRLLSSLRHEFVFQNGIYDVQYLARYWGIAPLVHLDTMLGHHAYFLGQEKSLAYLSSIYCKEHTYWKDDGKNWARDMDEDQLWTYNCEDAVRTWEISWEIEKTAKRFGQSDQVAFQMRQFPAVLRMMLRGVRCDVELKGRFAITLEAAARTREAWLQQATGLPFNIRSPKQMKEFFYDTLGIKPTLNRKTRQPTVDDKALEGIGNKYPWLRPITSRIQELRSIGVFFGTFVTMRLDRDGRIRCSYNIAGTETLRYSSSENAFGSGTNLQNIPQGGGDLPNVREMFVPDRGFEIAEFDLKSADAQVVAWEAGDDKLKEIFRRGENLHIENAKDLFPTRIVTPDSREYALAKRGVHATNYGITPRSLAVSLGISIHEAERFIRRWFEVHPAILDWQRRVDASLSASRSVANAFGFVRRYFGRVEELLPEALAWVPQSTVALIIARGLINIDENLPRHRIQPLLQTHDSLTIQYPSHLRNPSILAIKEQMSILVPYDDPLIIPVEVKISEKSWGAVKKYII